VILAAICGFSQAASIEKSTDVGVNPTVCLITHCGLQSFNCWREQECYDILMCMQKCQDSTSGTCILDCGLEKISNNEKFQNLMHCMVDHNCVPPVPENGVCLADDSDALNITDLSTLKGDWWVLKGQNCGQGGPENWSMGSDAYPCQHGRFIKVDDDNWINNTTFCAGKDSKCEKDEAGNDKYYDTLPKIYIPEDRPGVVRNDYPLGQAPLVPQVEDWKFVAMPHPDWTLVVWCGFNPMMKYNGAYVLSRKRSLAEMPADVEVEMRKAVAKFHMDYDAMCESDNTACTV